MPSPAQQRKPDASEAALSAAKAFVAYIEFFRTHGTGDCMRRYPDDEPMGGYDNIVRRAYMLAADCDGFDGRDRYRDGGLLTALRLAYAEIHNPGAARAEGKDVDAIVSDALKLASARERVRA
jgi:hypothetical protein